MLSFVVKLAVLLLLTGVDVRAEQSCAHSKKIDLQLIVDSSGSVGDANFHVMLQKIADNLLEQFDIGQGKTRVALFKYSAVMVNEFGLNSYNNIGALKKAVNAVKFDPGWTMTAEALVDSLKFFQKDMRQDPYTAKVCMVFTDGQATDEKEVPAASKAWREEGIKVFAVGIGDGIDMQGLRAIAGSKDRVIQTKSFEDIGKVAKSLLTKVCKEIPVHPCDGPDKGGCEQVCHKSGDGSFCGCKEGYRLAKNGRSCVKAGFDLKEVHFNDGVAEATNFLDMKWTPKNAFDRQSAIGHGWHIGKPHSVNEPTSFPVMIWYDFIAKGVVPSEVSFQPAQSGGATQGAPSSYQFVGSNAVNCDDDAEWTILCEDLSDRKWRSPYEVRYCKVSQDDEELQREFRCLGIRALKNHRSDGWTSIRNIRMWRRIEEHGPKDEL